MGSDMDKHAYADGRAAALGLFKVADYGALGRVLNHIYDLGSSTLLGGQAGALNLAHRAGAESGGAMLRHFKALPGAVGTAGKTFHGLGGTKALAGLAGPALALYGAHGLYQQHLKPKLDAMTAPQAPAAPYAGMF